MIPVMVALLLVMIAVPASAADPSPSADPSPTRRPTCAERYPVDGPGGVDLQLGCVIAELVSGSTSLGPSRDPERMSTWLIRLGAFVAGSLLLALAARALFRRLNQEMMPVPPGSWWSCPRCRSLNEDRVSRCYACGEPWTPAALTLDTPDSRPHHGQDEEDARTV